MKLMNEIKAETEEVVRAIHVQNAEAVEFGQLLFTLEPLPPRPLSSSRVQPRPRARQGGGRARDPHAARAGDRAVAIYSTADRDSLHVRLADRASLHRPAAFDRQLPEDPERHCRRRDRQQAVHPGWGFLAENPAFVHACEENDSSSSARPQT